MPSCLKGEVSTAIRVDGVGAWHGGSDSVVDTKGPGARGIGALVVHVLDDPGLAAGLNGRGGGNGDGQDGSYNGGSEFYF